MDNLSLSQDADSISGLRIRVFFEILLILAYNPIMMERDVLEPVVPKPVRKGYFHPLTGRGADRPTMWAIRFKVTPDMYYQIPEIEKWPNYLIGTNTTPDIPLKVINPLRHIPQQGQIDSHILYPDAESARETDMNIDDILAMRELIGIGAKFDIRGFFWDTYLKFMAIFEAVKNSAATNGRVEEIPYTKIPLPAMGEISFNDNPLVPKELVGPSENNVQRIKGNETSELTPDDLGTGTQLGDSPLLYYLRDIRKYALLTAEEEKVLAKQIKQAQIAEVRLNRFNPQNPMDEPSDRKKLEKDVKQGNFARETFINCNQRLVVSVARKYPKRGLPLLDLIEEGNIGLIKAVEKFDETKGYKFSTYGTWWIRQAITRAIADHARTIRLPVHITERLAKINGTISRLTQELGRYPTNQEIGTALELPETNIRQLLNSARPPESLDKPADVDEDPYTLGDILPDNSGSFPSPEQHAYNRDMSDHLNQIMSVVLTEQEALVLRLRFGLADGQDNPLTHEQVAQRLNLTKARIGQIERAALIKMRMDQGIKALY